MDESLTDEVIARQTPEAQAIIRSLLAVIQRQQATINALTARVRELEAKLGQNPPSPLNSSVPPSTEHPHAKSLPSRGSTKRRRGGLVADTAGGLFTVPDEWPTVCQPSPDRQGVVKWLLSTP